MRADSTRSTAAYGQMSPLIRNRPDSETLAKPEPVLPSSFAKALGANTTRPGLSETATVCRIGAPQTEPQHFLDDAASRYGGCFGVLPGTGERPVQRRPRWTREETSGRVNGGRSTYLSDPAV